MSKRAIALIALLSMMVVTLVAGTVGGIVGFAAARLAAPAPAEVRVSQPASAPASAGSLPLAPAAPSAPSAAQGGDIVAVVDKVKPAVVRIEVGNGSGSGVIIDEQGYILTNNHVVQGGRSFQVRFDNGDTAPARLIGTFPQYDLAVIKVDVKVPAVAALGDSTKLKVGERVVAFGSPLGKYTNTVTTGIVSGTNRTLGGIGGLIQHDAPINPGNSGGPLVNMAGEVVGINSMVDRSGMGDAAQGLGFAIPSSVARPVAQQLIAGKQPEYPYMGVSLEPASGGMKVASVEPTSGAAKGGLREGDVITAIEGQPITADTAVSALLANYSVGQTVQVQVVRDGQPVTLSVTLGKRPATNG